MADKKISQLPQINALSGSSIIVPLVHDSTTQKMELGAFASYVSQWSAKTGSANTFSGTQTFSGNVNVAGNVNVNGRLTVHEVVANYETASIIFSSGSNKFGDQPSDKHEFTGSTNITGSLYYNDVLVTNIDSNTVFKLQQATASIQFATQSLNTQTGSQESINTTLSIVTGSMRAEIGGIESYTASLKGQTIVSSSQQILNYNIFATTGSNTFIGNQNITGSLSISAGEFNVITGSGNMTSSLIFDHTQNDGVTLGLRHNDRLSLADHTFNTQVWAGGVYTQFVRNGTPYSILNVEAFDDNKIYLYRDTRLYNKSLVIDNNLTVQKDVIIGTGSLSIQRGQFSVTSASGDLTSSIGFKPVDYDLVQGASVFEVRHINNIYPEELALKLSVNDTAGTLFFEKNGSVYNVLSVGGSSNILFISRNTRLLGTSLLVDGGLTGSLLATNRVVSSSNQLFELNAQTGSQDLVNIGISSVTGSINTTTSSLIGITNALMGFTASLDNTYATDAQLYQLYQATASIHSATASFTAEIGGIEAYTASLKAAAIVSSSTQIQNYNLFALDANVAIKASGSTLYSTNPSTTNFSQVNSVFLGGGAGQDATGADSSIFLGYNAGIQATSAQESFFAGNTAGGYATNALRSTFIGISAGGAATNASYANFIGYGVGQSATNASNSNFIGTNTGFIATNASYANFIGYAAGQNATNASYSNFIGDFTGDGAANASYSNLFGFYAGKKVFGNGIGANNIIIGTNITLENDRRDSINFGGIIFATGSYRTTSGNPYSGSVGHGKVGINKILPSFELDISGSVGITGSLKVSEGITGSLYSTNGVISSSNQLFELNTQTGSQDLVNLGISTFTGSLRSEVNLIEAYTASLKAAAIVSSSTQIENYDVFALNSNLYNGTGSIKGEIAGIEAYTASLKGAIEVSGQNVNVLGMITAQQFNVTYVSSSVMYQSGSTKFGDSLDDRHLFTGSLNVSGGLSVIGTSAVTITANTAGNNTLNLISTNNVNSGKIQFGGATFGATIEKNSLVADTGLVFNSYHGGAEGYTFQSNGTDVMKLNSAGRLGIGVLNVDGNSKIHLADSTQGFVGIRLSGSGDYTGTDWTLYASSEAAPSATDFFGIYNNSTTDGATSEYKLKVYKGGDVNITNGNLVMGTAGKGIDFSATSNGSGTTTSELLNDYEEGTWTATATYSGTNTPTHAYQTGHYTKIGRVVHVQALVSWNENGSTGDLTITGLPFTSNSTVARPPASLMNFGFNGITTNLVGEVENSTTYIKIRKPDNSGTLVTATDTDNDQDLYINCTYMV